VTCEELEEEYSLYALGILEGPELAELEAHLQRRCPLCTRALAEMREVVDLLPFAAAEARPSPRVRTRLLERIGAKPAPARPAPAPARAAPVAPEPKAARHGWGWVPISAAACGLLLAAAALWSEWRVRAELRALEGEAAGLRIQVTYAQELLTLLQAPATRIITLGAPAEPSPAPSGKAFWNPERGLVFYAYNLAPLPPDRTYQLWVVTAAGPVSAGIFATNQQGEGFLRAFDVPKLPEAKALAVTDEPAGGVQQPTGARHLLAPL
jgi:anti-sigma-K factor RskA